MQWYHVKYFETACACNIEIIPGPNYSSMAPNPVGNMPVRPRNDLLGEIEGLTRPAYESPIRALQAILCCPEAHE